MGRPLIPLSITAEDQAQLRAWSKRPKTAQALAMRARIVLKAADGVSATATALEMKVCLQTVGKWRKRYAERGLDGLLDEPRPGQPRKITNADVERVLTLTLKSQPKAATHWSTREMAKASRNMSKHRRLLIRAPSLKLSNGLCSYQPRSSIRLPAVFF